MTSPLSRLTKAQLIARITELEAELAEQAARTEAAVAAAQRRSYWADTLEIDFDAIMRHRVGRRVMWVALKARGAGRRLAWYRERWQQR